MSVLVTGVAGFIGAAVAQQLLTQGEHVIGIDNLNDYYDPALKTARLALLTGQAGFTFEPLDVADAAGMAQLFSRYQPARVVHLAAQAGVRYSMQNPKAYVDSNLVGFVNILEGCRHHQVAHLVYASSSSIYGLNESLPFRETDPADHPVSLYGATKRANELMAHSYSHAFGLPTTALRFFTVYGPWGRPDMSLFSFTKAIFAGEPITLYNQGKHRRDFTYIDDIVQGVVRTLARAPVADPSAALTAQQSSAPWRVFNIGNSDPTELVDYVRAIERAIGRAAVIQLAPMQAGDVESTSASTDELFRWIGYRPSTPIDVGIEKFVAWYRKFYKV